MILLMGSQNIALITPIEQNKDVKIYDSSIKHRLFEEEAIRMV